MAHALSLLKTKFFIPHPTIDFVERKSLSSSFNKLKERPVMLVSASSGYGKSTIVADFLSKLNDDYTWLSLSEKENDFQQFITYFIKAIQIKVHNFGNAALALTSAPQFPDSEELAELIVNDLADLDKLIYFAIDDFHLIKNDKIHQFIGNLFEYPQPYFRLIIITRRDPELPLCDWLSKNKLIEIRSSDLRFNSDEIAEFYKKNVSFQLDDEVLSKLEEVTDGWISGMRMLTLSANDIDDLKQQIGTFKYKNSRVLNLLVKAVLKNHSDAVRDKVLRLSLLPEFNPDLYAELCLNEDEKEYKEVSFNDFLYAITRSNMFIIALDNKQNWFRFHHLFIGQFYEILLEEYKNEDIDELRINVAAWYSKHNLKEEAIEHYIKANQVSLALDVFTEFRLKLITETRFTLLDRIYNLFPPEFADKTGVLMVTKGWLLLQEGNIPDMAKYIEPLEELLIHEGHPRELLDLLNGEIHAMKAFDRYLSNVDIVACIEHSKQAISLLNDRNPYALGVAWVYYSASMYIQDQPGLAREHIYRKLETCSDDILKGQLLLILCFFDWYEGNLTALLNNSKHLLDLGHESEIQLIIANGNILSGIAMYYQNNDEKALPYLLKSHELRHFTYSHMSFATGMALADIYAKTGNYSSMETIIRDYETTALKQGGKLFIKIVKSATAELAWRYKNDLSGLKWAKDNDYLDFLPFADLYSAELVQACILTLDDDPASHKLAQKIINNTTPYFEERNDVNVVIRAFAIQAVIHYKSGDTEKAIEILQKVINLSCVGKYYRPFLELGESMKSLLLKYKITAKNSLLADEILQFFKGKADPDGKVILTGREQEILSLSGQMTNKELANNLFISEKTVKTHITNIYKKLKVTSKSEAISKANETGVA